MLFACSAACAGREFTLNSSVFFFLFGSDPPAPRRLRPPLIDGYFDGLREGVDVF